MASPVLDVSGWFSSGNSWTSATTGTVTVSTTAAAGVLLILVATNHHSGTQRNITGITASGLTFTKRKQIKAGDGHVNTLDIWSAPFASALSSKVVTVTADGTVESGFIAGAGFTGCHDNSAPFDSNVGLPASAFAASGDVTVSPFSTTQANDDLLFICEKETSSDIGASAGWSSSFNGGNAAGFLFCSIQVYTKSVSGAQSAQSVATTAGGSAQRLGAVDALTADGVANTETGTVVMSLAGIGYAGSGGRTETGTAVMALRGVSYNAAGKAAQEFGTAVMALRGVSIDAAGFDLGTPGKGVRQCWTF